MRHSLTMALACLALAGCGPRLAPVPSPALPVLPAELAARCSDPGVRAGQPALGELARNRAALAECRSRHAATVRFYDGLRARLAKGT